jgi:hypothetical protein
MNHEGVISECLSAVNVGTAVSPTDSNKKWLLGFEK